jgi:protein-S-isoprenylcysteine O-methyltransferase Ste14
MSKTPPIAVKFIIGLIIFTGLPLIGWGVADLGGFFSHPARLIYVIGVAILQFVTIIKFPTMGDNAQVDKQAAPAQRLALLLLQILPLAIVIGAPASDRHNLLTLNASDSIRYLGLIVFVLGFGLMQWAEAELGRQFSINVTLQTDHQLITSGPYRYVRHPRYVGIFAFNLGVALTFNSFLATILAIGLLIVLMWRIGTEEAMLRQAFGTNWATYAQRSWRFIPFVY